MSVMCLSKPQLAGRSVTCVKEGERPVHSQVSDRRPDIFLTVARIGGRCRKGYGCYLKVKPNLGICPRLRWTLCGCHRLADVLEDPSRIMLASVLAGEDFSLFLPPLAQRLFDSMIAGSELIHEVQPAIRNICTCGLVGSVPFSISTRTSAISCAHSAGT